MAMPVGYGHNVPNIPNFPFLWSASGFSYLGISVVQSISNLLRRNFNSVPKDIKSNLNRWMDLPINWMGRINLIKMNVLPWLLYLMQMLPLYISKEVAREVGRDFSKFIWQKKKPRLSMKTLQLLRDSGGLVFPNIILYNWAYHGRFIYNWVPCYLKGIEDPLESWACACAPFKLLGELTCKKTALSKVRDNPILQSSIKIWHEHAIGLWVERVPFLI